MQININKTKSWMRRKIPIWPFLLGLIISIIFINIIFFSGTLRTQLKIICADSLVGPFQELAEQFEIRNPDVDVLVEGHGSIQVIRHVTELGDEMDLMAVANYSLIPMMMYGNEIPGTGQSYANWYMKFATNRLGLVYTAASK